jgi:hypothetical protein
MAINVTERVLVDGTQESISDFMFNPQNDTVWIGGILEVKSITKIHRIAHFMGKDVDYILEITKLEPGKELSMKSIKSPFPMEVSYLIEPNDEIQPEPDENPGCFVKIRIRGKSKGYFMFIDRLLSLMVSHNIRGDLRSLKEILEGKEDQ